MIVFWLEKNGYQPSEKLVNHLFDIAKSQRRLMEDEEVKNEVNTFLDT